MLKKSTLLSVSIFLVLFIGLSDYGYGCHKGTDGPHGPFNNCGDPGPPGGGGDDGGDKYTFSVFFDETGCNGDDGNRNRFCSDLMGAYSDEDTDVSAVGDKFRVSLTLQAAGFRRFFLDFRDNCVSPQCGDVPVLLGGDSGLTSGSTDNVFSIDKEFSSLLDMNPEGDTQARLVFISFRDENRDGWVLTFSPDDCEDSKEVTVTRSGDTWLFEPDVDGIACLTRAKNGKSGPQILQGLYEVPFGFTVTLLP